MRAVDIFKKKRHSLGEQIINELKMNPSSLEAFAKSAEAKDLVAGFEAELVFEGAKAGGEKDDVPVTEYNQLLSLFDNDGRSWTSVKDSIDNAYSYWQESMFVEHGHEATEEWIRDTQYDYDSAVREYLEDQKGMTWEEIDASFEDMDDAYDEAVEHVEDQIRQQASELISYGSGDQYYGAKNHFMKTTNEDISFEAWLEHEGLETLSDVAEWADVEYPNSHFSTKSVLEKLSTEFAEKFSVETKFSTRYHAIEREEGVWIFEPDSSIDVDEDEDVAVEIVSPPMPFMEALVMVSKVLRWARSKGAYTNDSTGFHIGVSLPNQTLGSIDYTKLVLFLGDMHVLKAFDRESNQYARSSLAKIKNTLTARGVEDVYSILGRDLDQAANTLLGRVTIGGDRYVSVNLKDEYVEFRSAGGDYVDDVRKIQLTMLRYARAYVVAADESAEKVEYAKKLYRLLNDVREELNGSTDPLQLFVKYTTGVISRSELLSKLKFRNRKES